MDVLLSPWGIIPLMLVTTLSIVTVRLYLKVTSLINERRKRKVVSLSDKAYYGKAS
ncbi:hypothetical protein AB9P05_18795 [Roseivirga sp. BDSF3-8]|uniref:hypothetical protein n=1 Tax=Roseivirga sp. BDSF3-8 TaxID=3241598 RepID=UPI0035318213